jgi:hypothetical protein
MKPFWAWPGVSPPDRRNQCEQQVLDHEPPCQEADDRAHLVAHDHADAHPDPAPQSGSHEGSQREQLVVVSMQGERDAAPVQDHRADPHREQLSHRGEHESGQEACNDLGGDHLPTARVEQERRPDRAEPVFARHEEDAGKCREHPGEAADAEQVALVLLSGQARDRAQEPSQQHE